ncbi:MAG: hypothetical protein WBA57_03035 [Elainellaceae cyanobacterium]
MVERGDFDAAAISRWLVDQKKYESLVMGLWRSHSDTAVSSFPPWYLFSNTVRSSGLFHVY